MNRTVTIEDIAKKLGVSASTVSRALHDHPRIGKETKERVKALAKELHYVPNPAAVLLQNQKASTIGILIPSLKEEFFARSIYGIEDIILSESYHIMISQSRNSMLREKKMIKSFLSARIDGLIVSISSETNQYEHFRELEECGIPIVFFDRVPRNFEANKVRCNVKSGVKKALKYLVNKGVKKIALINGPSNLTISDERLDAYLEFVLEYGLITAPKYIKSSDLSQTETEDCMSQLCKLDSPPEAVLTFNDKVAIHAMSACRRQGFSPNKDILFVSFANSPINKYLENPPLASVNQFANHMGQRAAQLLLKCMDTSKVSSPYEEVIIETELIVH